MNSPIVREHTVHLCLDMQRLFAAGGIWATPWIARVTPQIVRLGEAMETRNVFTRFIPPIQPDDAPGMWRPFFHKWEHVTRSRLNPEPCGWSLSWRDSHRPAKSSTSWVTPRFMIG